MTKTKKKQALKPCKWSGRFARGIDPRALTYTQSISFDRRLYRYDIVGSLVHAKMLHRVGVLKADDYKRIARGLNGILQEIEAGRFAFREEDEDVHLNIEKALIARIGPAGGRLHTARSRNDQVALDVRLYCRDHLRQLHAGLVDLEKVFLKKARGFLGVVMPGYTHLQRAQPVLFSHHLMAYVEMFERDRGRLEDAYKRLNLMPLGSGALAGTTFPLDREFVAKELGFDGVTRNSLDAVSDRDFAVEIAAAGALLMVHLSRLSEELILWSSSEFDFVKLPESFCTGSSMMPQKMNPDVPELVRGKTGRVVGHLMGLLTLIKGLPLAYNKDLQEDKEAIFGLFDTLIPTVRIVAALIAGTRPNVAKTEKAASDGFLLATDLADWLVRHGVDFRSSHEITARIVRHALERGKNLRDLTLAELKGFSGKFTPDVFRALDVKAAVNHRRVTGGTAKANVAKEIGRMEMRLKNASL
ncbi:MAG TPA: argininosuccinate lyase [bacterium]|nr:argininosuccinate lyase [bacterium]